MARAKELYKSIEIHKKEEASMSKINSVVYNDYNTNISDINLAKDGESSKHNNQTSAGDASTANTMGTLSGVATSPTIATLDNIVGSTADFKSIP